MTILSCRRGAAVLVVALAASLVPFHVALAQQEPGAKDAPAQAPAQAPAATTAPATKPPDDGPRTEGLIPGILIGPKVTGTVLFPPSLMVGAELKVIGYVGASFEYGVYPRSLTVNEINLKISSWSAGVRAYPFRGAFFVGAVFGAYDLTGTQPVPGGLGTLNVKSFYLGPQIGWKWAFDFGLFLGLNLGYGFNLGYQSTLTVPGVGAGDLASAQQNLDKYIKTGVPILTLLELGWLL
jgi:hypothetical protein